MLGGRERGKARRGEEVEQTGRVCPLLRIFRPHSKGRLSGLADHADLRFGGMAGAIVTSPFDVVKVSSGTLSPSFVPPHVSVSPLAKTNTQTRLQSDLFKGPTPGSVNSAASGSGAASVMRHEAAEAAKAVSMKNRGYAWQFVDTIYLIR